MIRIRNNETGEIRVNPTEGDGWTSDPNNSLNCDCWLAYWFKLAGSEETRLNDESCGFGLYTVISPTDSE